MRRVREIILRADPRVTEYVKYRTANFGYEGDMVAFVGMDKKPVTLMFHRGARINGRFPHLEGTHPSARFMRFKDAADVEARAIELTSVVVAWCALVTPESQPTKATAKPTPKATMKTTAKATGKARATAKSAPRVASPVRRKAKSS